MLEHFAIEGEIIGPRHTLIHCDVDAGHQPLKITRRIRAANLIIFQKKFPTVNAK